MAERLFEIFFGNKAHTVLDSYRQLSQLQQNRQYLQANYAQIQDDLDAFSETKGKDLEANRRRLEQLTAAADEDQQQLKDLRAKAAEVDHTLNNGLRRLWANFMASVSSSYSSTRVLQAAQSQWRREIKGLEKRLYKTRKTIGRMYSGVNRASRSLDSIEFALNRLKEDLNAIDRQIAEIDEAINQYIRSVARYSALQAFMLRHRRLETQVGRQTIERAIALRRALVRQSAFRSFPAVEVSERAVPFGIVDVVKGVQRGFRQVRENVAGRIPMRGRGTAHKKVSTGKSTTWKRINVDFSGSVHAVFTVEAPEWESRTAGDVLEHEAVGLLHEGLAKARDAYSGKLAADLRRQVRDLTAAVRADLEASINLRRQPRQDESR